MNIVALIASVSFLAPQRFDELAMDLPIRLSGPKIMGNTTVWDARHVVTVGKSPVTKSILSITAKTNSQASWEQISSEFEQRTRLNRSAAAQLLRSEPLKIGSFDALLIAGSGVYAMTQSSQRPCYFIYALLQSKSKMYEISFIDVEAETHHRRLESLAALELHVDGRIDRIDKFPSQTASYHVMGIPFQLGLPAPPSGSIRALSGFRGFFSGLVMRDSTQLLVQLGDMTTAAALSDEQLASQLLGAELNGELKLFELKKTADGTSGRLEFSPNDKNLKSQIGRFELVRKANYLGMLSVLGERGRLSDDPAKFWIRVQP